MSFEIPSGFHADRFGARTPDRFDERTRKTYAGATNVGVCGALIGLR